MSLPKPQPKELTVRRLDQYALLNITTSSTDAAAWIEREAPQFGALTGPSPMLPYYLLAVGDVWDTDEVLTYLMSYTADNAPHTARFELRSDPDTGRRYWYGSEDGWKDATEVGENGILTLDGAHFAVGTVLTLVESLDLGAEDAGDMGGQP